MEIHQFQNLLNQVKAITARYKKINELTGENFNIFQILKLESSEVRMHSAFLAELLNPKGSHGQKDIFLKLFVEAFCFKENIIETISCKVKVEDHIGLISTDKTQGGRIDITITDANNHQIIIENKIYAGDQNHQLLRYYNYSENADIIYLTLDGKDAEKHSKGDLNEGEHYKKYSYKYDIINWLELCRKEVAIYPIVREAITHYINLIKHLTNQTINQTMEEEISDLLKGYLQESFIISANLDKACKKISDDFGLSLTNAMSRIGMTCEYNIDFEKKHSEVYIYKPEWKYFSICFGLQRFDKDLIYGFCADDPNSIPSEVLEQFVTIKNNKSLSSEWWPWFMKMEDPFYNWYNFEAWQAILDGTMESAMLKKVNDLLTLSKVFTM